MGYVTVPFAVGSIDFITKYRHTAVEFSPKTLTSARVSLVIRPMDQVSNGKDFLTLTFAVFLGA